MFPNTLCVQQGKETAQVRVFVTGMCLSILTLKQVNKLEFGQLFKEAIPVA